MTHVCNNAFADSSTSKVGPVHGGLSQLGRFAVKEMNRIGMIVDASHVTMDCAKQILKLSRVPIMFSHSNAMSVFECDRNVADEILDMVPKNRGIVMVTFVPEHVAKRRKVCFPTLWSCLLHVTILTLFTGCKNVKHY